MSTSGIIFLLLSGVMTVAANLLLRIGIGRAGGFAPTSMGGIATGLFKLFQQPLFTAGFVIYFFAAVVWFRVIAYEPMSTAYPVLVGLTFCLVTLGAIVFFGETIALRKAIGLTVIFVGIVIVSTSAP